MKKESTEIVNILTRHTSVRQVEVVGNVKGKGMRFLLIWMKKCGFDTEADAQYRT